MIRHILLVLVLLNDVINDVTSQAPTSAPGTQPFTECCELNLMDVTQRVAIETSRALPTGTYQALRVRTCTTDPIYLQIWTIISGSGAGGGGTQYQLKWQILFTATVQQTNQISSTINIQSIPVTLTSNDRFGFYNPSNSSFSSSSSSKSPIPYDTVSQTAGLYFSTQRFTSDQVISGLQVTLDDLKWPRTFAAYLAFCPTTDCSTTSLGGTGGTTPSLSGSVGPPGPPGPPGPCCTSPVTGCDPGSGVSGGLQNQDAQVQSLRDTINRLEEILKGLLNSNSLISGTCPDSRFTAGVYGDGWCYVVRNTQKLQMAQAILDCRDNYSAGLLKFTNSQGGSIEDVFVRGLVTNGSAIDGTQAYWMSAMYNTPVKVWDWYDDSTLTKTPIPHPVNWLNGFEPTPTSIYDICALYTVANTPAKNITSYWVKADCTTLNYYVCALPKKCL